MNAVLIWYPKCGACQKAAKWLAEHGIAFETRDIREQNPAAEELREWQELSGLPLKKFFNTSGLVYKSMGLKEKLPSITQEEQFALLATDGMLVKRPILLVGKTVLVGFKPAEWEERLS